MKEIDIPHRGFGKSGHQKTYPIQRTEVQCSAGSGLVAAAVKNKTVDSGVVIVVQAGRSVGVGQTLEPIVRAVGFRFGIFGRASGVAVGGDRFFFFPYKLRNSGCRSVGAAVENKTFSDGCDRIQDTRSSFELPDVASGVVILIQKFPQLPCTLWSRDSTNKSGESEEAAVGKTIRGQDSM